MKEKQSNERRSKLLDRLQEESWQLELIVSGVAIFLLLGAYEPMEELRSWAFIAKMGANSLVSVAGLFLGFLQISYLLLIGMFLLHLCIRGIWIGAIGLRSVSGDFDYEVLDYQPKFSRFLRRRLGNFDDYIGLLERNASVTFSLAFLLFFAILSIGLFFMAISIGIFVFTGSDGQLSMGKGASGKWLFYLLTTLSIAWFVVMALAGILYFIDFITFGWLKRRRWLQRVYYPFYRFLGWVTLARLYRPIYYNIIDNRFGKRLVGAYLGVAFLIVMGLSFNFMPFTHFSYDMRKAGVVHPGNYLDSGSFDLMSQRNFNYPSLGSRFATTDYMEVFIPSNSKRYKSVLKKQFPDLRPLTPHSISLEGRARMQNISKEKIDSTLRALTSINRLYLNDSLLHDVRWKFYEHPLRKQPGLLYDLPVHNLTRGEYLIRFEEQRVKNDSLYWQEMTTISFMR